MNTGNKQIDPNIFKGLTNELKNVSWPSREEALHLTLVVVIISLSVGIYIGILDSFFAQLLKIFINLKK